MSGRLAPKITLSITGAVKIVTRMMAPVLCANCGSIYDSIDVKVTARFADASLWKAPCCGVESDDRPYVGRAIRLDTPEAITSALGADRMLVIRRRRIVKPDGTDY